jgi:hypothetical protein
MTMTTEERNIDSTIILTRVESKCSVDSVIRLGDIEKRLIRQREADIARLHANYAEQNNLLKHVQRFKDLEDEAKTRHERISRIVGLMGSEKFDDLKRQIAAGDDVSRQISVTVEEDLPLWMAMKAIVEQVSEIQVVELQQALAYFGKKASRQAIESALASHKETFETKAKNRDKFVSLKR